MTYKELRQIAQPHIRESENLPSNSFLLLNQLHIPFKNESQCEKDFGDNINPLKNNPAFMFIGSNGNKTIYFNSNTPYWNFYIFHEIAHYILGHEQNSPQNEIDADMLACVLAAPVENLPTYLKSARDLSSLCKIPIDKAEMYWQEIKEKFSNWHKKIWVIGCIIATIVLSVILYLYFYNQSIKQKNIEESNIITTPSPDVGTYNEDDLFFITTSGTHYHLKDCRHIKYKNNTIQISKYEVDILKLEPCEDCIK